MLNWLDCDVLRYVSISPSSIVRLRSSFLRWDDFLQDLGALLPFGGHLQHRVGVIVCPRVQSQARLPSSAFLPYCFRLAG